MASRTKKKIYFCYHEIVYFPSTSFNFFSSICIIYVHNLISTTTLLMKGVLITPHGHRKVHGVLIYFRYMQANLIHHFIFMCNYILLHICEYGGYLRIHMP